jgi:hypothetical protein
VLYCRGTVNLRGASGRLRWQLAIAIVAALSLFVALIAGSSLRPKFAAAALPEPAAWTHATPGAQAHASQMQLHPVAQPNSHLDQGFSPTTTPPQHKPFHSMWMTRDRPSTWAHLAPQLAWSPWPVSLSPWETAWPVALGSQSGCAQPAAVIAGRDILTQLCVARR